MSLKAGLVPSRWTRRDSAWVVGACVLVSTAIRLWFATTYFGFQTGDDVEIAERAFSVALGLSYQAWDIRHLFVPDVIVAPLVRGAQLLGASDARLLLLVARAPFILLSGVNIVLAYVVARRWYGEGVASLSALMYSAHWVPLVYGSSLYPRVFSVTCVLGAVALVSRPERTSRFAVAGLLTAAASSARYSELIYLATPLLSLYAERRKVRRRDACAFVFCVLSGLALIGWYDRVTWGRWFSSLLAFGELTFVRADATSREAVQPLWWYFTSLPHWLPVTLLPGLFAATWRGQSRRVAVFVALPLLALSAVFHKELRYLQVVLPFAVMISVSGVSTWLRPGRGRAVGLLLLAFALPLSMGRIGQVMKRSTNAAAAAISISAARPESVALSQSWAYGGRIFLGNRPAITELGVPTDRSRVEAALSSASVLALYERDSDEGIARICAREGLTRRTLFNACGGRSVVVFSRTELPLLALRCEAAPAAAPAS